MSKAKYDLVVVAHPDDETLYFGALLLKQKKRPWKVICVTDGNADGKGRARKRQFNKACSLLGVSDFEQWAYPDIFEQRLNHEQLAQDLSALPRPVRVFTHGILGEYGHPHHQDVSAAVHSAFQSKTEVWSTAYNCYPNLVVKLSPEEFRIKTHILASVYGSETRRFANLLPATAVEGFTQASRHEVQAIYSHLTHTRHLKRQDLETYRWFWPYLRDLSRHDLKRLF